MNGQTTNRAVVKSTSNAATVKAPIDHGKVINQLRQEINTLNKAVKEMQRKPDIQMVIVGIPRELFSKVTAYLLDYEKETSDAVSLSEFISEAAELYLYVEEENKRIEEERKRDGLAG
jgi:hypothetical protein